MSLKIYSYPGNSRVNKTLVAARINSIDIEVPEFKFPADNRNPSFKCKNPFQKVPCLETPCGKTLFEHLAILRYVASLNPVTGLLGTSFWDQAQVDQWIHAINNEFCANKSIIYYMIKGYVAPDKNGMKNAKGNVRKFLAVFEEHMKTRTYIVGQRVTIADISLAVDLQILFGIAIDPNWAKQIPNTMRWFNTVINQKAFADVLPKTVFCKKPAPLPKPVKKQQKKKPKQQPKKQQPKKKKEPHWSEKLEKSPLILDVVKKHFSNEKDQKVAVDKFFSEMHDPKGYCCVTVKYKYPEDNEVDWKTSNLVNGVIQRMQGRGCVRFGFGTFVVLGKEDTKGPFHIEGAFLFRGNVAPPELLSVPDMANYAIDVVDVSGDEGKKLWGEYFYAEEIHGLPVFDRTSFK